MDWYPSVLNSPKASCDKYDAWLENFGRWAGTAE